MRLADFRGTVVILNFWASGCPPCRKEIPGLVEIQGNYAARGVTVIGISLDDEVGLAKSTVETLKVNYPIVIGDPLVTASYGNVSVVPSTFVIDREGKIVALHEGLAEMAALEAEIHPLL